MPRTSAWLIGLILSLLLVGLVSHTPIRHAIQISPCVMALALSWRGSKWGSASALGLFAFWLTIMTLIWLFLLGIAKVISGHFTPVEIALTISIGVCCLGGALSATQGFKNRAIVPASAICASFLVLQTAALWLSMRPQFARI